MLLYKFFVVEKVSRHGPTCQGNSLIEEVSPPTIRPCLCKIRGLMGKSLFLKKSSDQKRAVIDQPDFCKYQTLQ